MKKNMMKFSIGILTVSLLISGCGTSESMDDFTEDEKETTIVGVVSKSSTSEYWMSVNSGMETAAAENHMKIVFFPRIRNLTGRYRKSRWRSW